MNLENSNMLSNLQELENLNLEFSSEFYRHCNWKVQSSRRLPSWSQISCKWISEKKWRTQLLFFVFLRESTPDQPKISIRISSTGFPLRFTSCSNQFGEFFNRNKCSSTDSSSAKKFSVQSHSNIHRTSSNLIYELHSTQKKKIPSD